MEAAFWEQAWTTGKTGFHKSEVNPQLIRHAHRLLDDGPHTVLVPLCGRSLDLLWLREQGHRVIGVELVEEAVSGFFTLHGLPVERRTAGPLTCWQSGELVILQGDVFALTPELLPWQPTAVWDRAAMVALPPERRAEYVALLVQHLVAPGTRMLLDVFDYDPAEMSGPPFHVPGTDVRDYFRDCNLELIEVRDGTAELNRPDRPITRFDMLTWLARVPPVVSSPSR